MGYIEKSYENELQDLRAALAESERKVKIFTDALMWADRIQREAKAVERNKGNFNGLNLALKGYKEWRESLS